MPKLDLSDTDQCLCLASRQAARAVTRAFEQRMRGADIRSTQFSLLVQLVRRGPLSIGDLAQPLEIFELCGAIALQTGDSSAAGLLQ